MVSPDYRRLRREVVPGMSSPSPDPLRAAVRKRWQEQTGQTGQTGPGSGLSGGPGPLAGAPPRPRPLTSMASPVAQPMAQLMAQPAAPMAAQAPAPDYPAGTPPVLAHPTASVGARTGSTGSFYGKDVLDAALGTNRQGQPRKGAKALQRLMAGVAGSNALMAQEPLWQAITQLMQQTQQGFSDSEIAARLAPHLDALDDSFTQQQGRLDRDLQARGLGESSGAVEQYADLAGRRASTRANLVSGLYQDERNRELQLQAMLRDLLASLSGRSTSQAADIASTIRSQNLQREQLDAMQGGGLDFGGLLGGLGSLLGSGGLSGLIR